MNQRQYDVAVIGSGIGGICSAALLAHAGYRTLVVEKLPFLGGRFSTVDYQGYRCTTGAIGIELGGMLEGICAEVGAHIDVRPAGRTATWIGGKLHDMPQKGALRALVSSVAEDTTETERVMGALRRALSWAEPSDAIPFREWLLQHTKNEKIHSIFRGTITSLHTVNDDELPAGEYFRFLKTLSPLRFGWAARGNIQVVEALAKVVRDRGGAVWTRATARRILAEGGIARGLEVQVGDDRIAIDARAVISNAGPSLTAQLAGPDRFERGYLRHLRDTVLPTPIVWIHFVSDRPLTQYSAVSVAGARRVNMINTPTMECPELAPPGQHLSMSGGAPLNSLLPIDFRKEIDLNLQDLKDIVPGFDRYARVLWVSCFSKGWPGLRTWPSRTMAIRTPIENLYNVGDAVLPPGTIGTVGAARSARIVADDVRSRIAAGQARVSD